MRKSPAVASLLLYALVFSVFAFPLNGVNATLKTNSASPVVFDTTYFPVAVGTPLQQNWTNTGLITTNDDWSGVPSIIGYRGDDLTVATGTDPQTILVDGSAVVDVNANQINPDTFNTGGATEFEITDPVVALSGSGTADAPFLDFRLDTSACASPANTLNIAYNVRDIDGSVDNAVQQVALQFRVGATGDYTNIPAGYIADATTGPSLATLVTPISLALPTAAQGQAQVHVRIMTTNAVGNDEWVGVDDMVIGCQAAGGGNPGSFSFNPISYSPAESVGIQTVTVSRNGGTDGAVTVNYSDIVNTFRGKQTEGDPPATGGAACAFGSGVDYITPSGTLSFANGVDTQTFNVTICDDQLFEGSELLNLGLSGATGGATITIGNASVLIQDNDSQPIVELSAATANVNEGAIHTATITRTGAVENVVSVQFNTSANT
ncbi:MAG: Calx-beta domain-containing protein, partial [Pyrinomonadaceae bacterium]